MKAAGGIVGGIVGVIGGLFGSLALIQALDPSGFGLTNSIYGLYFLVAGTVVGLALGIIIGALIGVQIAARRMTGRG